VPSYPQMLIWPDLIAAEGLAEFGAMIAAYR
jgi:hypothetical protein